MLLQIADVEHGKRQSARSKISNITKPIKKDFIKID